MGHLDYICRRSPYTDPNLYYEDFSREIDEIWRLCLKYEIIPEINTRRFYDEDAILSLIPIYRQYHKMGGKYVTLGSDAHVANIIGKYFDRAEHLADLCQLRPIYLKKQQIVLATEI